MKVIYYDEMVEMTPEQWRYLLKRLGKEPPTFSTSDGIYAYVGPRLEHPRIEKMTGIAEGRR